MNGKKAKLIRDMVGYHPSERSYYEQTNLHNVESTALNLKGDKVLTGSVMAYTATLAMGSNRRIYQQMKKEVKRGVM